MARAFVGMGSNLGERTAHLSGAIAALMTDPSTTVIAVSPLYETAPVGNREQDDFLNAVVEIETESEPAALLALLHDIENNFGRQRLEHWGPRTLDLDLLDYEGFHSSAARLTVPHPRAEQRRFVLQPWSDIAPTWQLSETSVSQRLHSCPDDAAVSLVDSDKWWLQ